MQQSVSRRTASRRSGIWTDRQQISGGRRFRKFLDLVRPAAAHPGLAARADLLDVATGLLEIGADAAARAGRCRATRNSE